MTAVTTPKYTDLHDPSLYFNRELSWIQFNERVLREALDPDNWPLLERLKFLSIFSTNLDEFFMIRVAGLKQQIGAEIHKKSPDGLTPEEQLKLISEQVHRQVDAQITCFMEDILPKLETAGIYFHHYRDLNPAHRKFLDKLFKKDIFPVLTPLGFDPGRPFPHLLNISIYIAFFVRDANQHEEEPKFAIVQMPSTLPRLIPLPYKRGTHFALLEDVISANAHRLFLGYDVLECYPFQVTRDADLEIAEDEADDLLETVEREVNKRRWGKAVRLAIDHCMPDKIRGILADSLNLHPQDVYEVKGPLNLSDFMQLYKLDRPDLKDKPFTPRSVPDVQGYNTIFDAIQEKDILLHHPYESFNSVIDFVRTAAEDPNVLAIKMTLYRTGVDSPILRALSTAVENGKQVAVLVELKARFDEENNIVWARLLAKSGVHVVYGLLGLKTHCKVALVVRREGNLIRRYVHLATGNYNPTTAKIYTDLGLMTCHPDFGEDVSHLFNYLTGYSRRQKWRKLLVSPLNLRQELIRLVRDEIIIHEKSGNGWIILKMNSLLDAEMIRYLYQASQAGVRVDLLIRGICSLRPGVPGISDNIRVKSIVGRFLEHSRIFYFRNGGDERVYLGSADWMPRNLDRRVETVFPVEDPRLKRRITDEILITTLKDNVKSYELKSDGTYEKIPHSPENAVNCQEIFLNEYD
ncbi:MAG: polyphosphate kinase 1 [Gemmatimonadetes bacterium]|nr:MAG: polyphosphate kinase 1 [Gemmatimonadota bacterium]